ALAYSPNGEMLASGSDDNTIKLWDVATEKEKATLKGHSEGVFSVAFSPDGTTLASVGQQEIKLWNVATGKEVRHFKHSGIILSLAFSPDGKTLASGGSTA